MTTPGTRWVATSGPHRGAEVEVVKLTGSGRVTIRHIGGEGDSWSTSKSKSTGLATIPRAVFLASYQARGDLVPTGLPNRGGRSYRRNGATSQASLDTPLGASALAETPTVPTLAPGELRLEVLTVTPDLARGWLDRGGANRKVSETRVARFADMIRKGEWMLTGEAIKLDADGRVRDGQHRLEAIYRAGVPVQSVVVRNVAEDAFDVMDTGRPRTAGDVLGIHGIASRNEVAATARGLIILERHGRLYVHAFTNPPPTIREQLDYALAHPEIVDAVKLAARLRTDGFIGGVGLWAIPLALFLRVDEAATQAFVDRLIAGDNLASDSPILKLRNQFRASYAKWDASARGRENLVALVIKGWNAWRAGQSTPHLSWRSEGRGAEAFPTPDEQ